MGFNVNFILTFPSVSTLQFVRNIITGKPKHIRNNLKTNQIYAQFNYKYITNHAFCKKTTKKTKQM